MRHKSRVILDGNDRAGARAMLKGTGFDDDDLKRPIIGVAHCWIETMPCNLNQRDLAQHVKEGIRAAGGTPQELNTISVSDGVTMGTEGMKASLISREVIADSVELVARGHMFDAIIGIGACDKTLPGLAMALVRLNIPGILLYSGSIMPGHFHDKEVTIRSVYEAIGANAAGKMSDEELIELETSPARVRERVADSTPRTPWRWRWSSLVFRRWAQPHPRLSIHARWRSARKPAR
jgi:dihydroxy-acid dehydratase